MIQVIPVILCGGSGTRLWPLSRTGFPKQFLCLTGAESLFQEATKRLVTLKNARINVAAPYIVTNEEHRFLALEQLREAGVELGAALLEPVGRNTAPALTLAALAAVENGDDPVLVVTPADQVVTDSVAFAVAIEQAVYEASGDSIIILGVRPELPETGYGYIKAKAGDIPSAKIFDVERFVEKPDSATAQRYLDEGGYFWNAGMFVLKASVWLSALEAFRPDIAKATRAAWSGRTAETSPATLFVRPEKDAFKAIPGESIDYAVMEPATRRSAAESGIVGEGARFAIKMIPLNVGWNDLGAWDALWQVLPKDEAGNAHRGDVLTTDSRNTLVHTTSRLVSLVGVENIVVIETPDAVLVANKSSSQNVKHIVDALKQQRREERIMHRKVHRPWGWYDCVDEGERFKVKRIQVRPKASLSLQKHRYRAEHWIVVKGTAEITCGDKTIFLSENQSTYIPLGEIHCLANPGTIPLEIVEVQSGSYLGEDDIIRFGDDYGRSDC